MSEKIFRPDAHPEISSVDGYVYTFAAAGGEDWAVIRAGIFNRFASNDAAAFAGIVIKSDAAMDKWAELYRSVLSFDTLVLPNGALITNVVLSLHGGAGKDDELSIAPEINIYSVALIDDTDIVLGQPEMETMWDSFGDTAFATAIPFASWDDAGWNDFVFNVAGRAAISTNGNTRFGVREVKYDVSGTPPAWSHVGADDTSRIYWWTADWSADLAPKLTVTYYSGQDTVDQTIIGNKVSLEAIRNLEIVYGGRDYISKLGNWVHESRYHRNV